MRVQNPNDRALPVKGIYYTLDVAGQEFAHGVSGASFVVPALGEAEFDMNVTANMAGALIKLLGTASGSGEHESTTAHRQDLAVGRAAALDPVRGARHVQAA